MNASPSIRQQLADLSARQSALEELLGGKHVLVQEFSLRISAVSNHAAEDSRLDDEDLMFCLFNLNRCRAILECMADRERAADSGREFGDKLGRVVERPFLRWMLAKVSNIRCLLSSEYRPYPSAPLAESIRLSLRRFDSLMRGRAALSRMKNRLLQ